MFNYILLLDLLCLQVTLESTLNYVFSLLTWNIIRGVDDESCKKKVVRDHIKIG